MTAQEANQLVQGIFDNIFNSVTQADSGGGPLMQASSTMLSLLKPGMAISSHDFANPWTPGNLNGSKDAAINSARLVDDALKLSSIYTESGNSVSQIYKQILDGVSVPAQPANPAIEKQLKDSHDLLFRNIDVTDPDTGEHQTKVAETVLYRDYLDNQANYTNARQAYIAAYLEAQKTASGRNTWPLIAPSLQIPVKTAYDRWRAESADKVEQAIAIMNTSSQNALSKAFDNAKHIFEGYGVTLEETGGLSTPIQRVSLLPSDWHNEHSTTKWTTVDISAGSSAASSSSDYTSYGGSAGFSLGIFSIGGSAGHSETHKHMSTQTSNLEFSFEYTLVVIRRAWMVFNLLGTKTWNLGNLYKKGLISTGSKANQEKAAMPLLPTAFVVARKINISAHWAKADWDYLQSQTHGGGSVGIGPFSIGGSYEHSHSKSSFTSSFANGHIIAPGVQIIGVISQVVPFCPPA